MVNKMMKTKKVQGKGNIINVDLGSTPGTNGIADTLITYEIITKYIKEIKELIKFSNFDCYDPSVQNDRLEVKKLRSIEYKIKTIEKIYSGKKRKKIQTCNFPDSYFKYLKDLYISLLEYKTRHKYDYYFSHIEGYM